MNGTPHRYSNLPQVDECLRSGASLGLLADYSRARVVSAVRDALNHLRDQVRQGGLREKSRAELLELALHSAREALGADRSLPLQPVFNATGVILQTNLGRAPLSQEALEAVAAVARGYCNLEYDLKSGERGQRGAHVEKLLLETLECAERDRAALIVNNCAAATLLALDSLAAGGEVIVSRGELVEIGGGFRVPDILRKSGARLVEVGTTNRTRIDDYAAAISPETRLILRVHRSNFEITGFTEQPSLDELVHLGIDAEVPVFEDQGTGCIIDLQTHGIHSQSSFAASIRSGATLVSASGDKLLGGPQCGLLVGAQSYIQRLRGNPLYRAVRVDKMTYAALQATLSAYAAGRSEAIPAISMLSTTPEAVRRRCERCKELLASSPLQVEVVASDSVLGGGTTPGATVSSYALALSLEGWSADALAMSLRRATPPIIARIRDGRLLLDLRTILENEDDKLVDALRSAHPPRAAEIAFAQETGS